METVVITQGKGALALTGWWQGRGAEGDGCGFILPVELTDLAHGLG